MDFESLLELLRNPGEDGPGETIYDDLSASYNDRVSAGDAKVSELTASNENSAGEIARLKAHNYDLLMQVQQGNPTGDRGDLDDVNESEESDGEIISLDDIISYD